MRQDFDRLAAEYQAQRRPYDRANHEDQIAFFVFAASMIAW